MRMYILHASIYALCICICCLHVYKLRARIYRNEFLIWISSLTHTDGIMNSCSQLSHYKLEPVISFAVL